MQILHDMATHFVDGMTLFSIDLGGLKKEGDSNVLSVLQTVYTWIVIIAIIGLAVFKKFRAAVGVLVAGAIVGVFVYFPDNIIALGKSILEFLGIMG